MMPPRKRLFDFDGEDRAYLGFLCEKVHGLPLEKCIQNFEDTLQKRRPNQSSTAHCALKTSSPSAIEKSSQNHESNPRSPQTGKLVINIWQPTDLPKNSYDTQSENPSQAKTPSGTPKWRSRTKSFFEGLPKTEEDWSQLRTSSCFSTPDNILHVVDCLDSGRLIDTRPTNHDTPQNLADSLLEFAQSARAMLLEGKLSRNISQFNSLVFLATCHVASQQRHPKNDGIVNTAMRQFLSYFRGGDCTAHDRQLDKIRTGVKWLVEEMGRQCRRGLGHRAFELFFHSKKEGVSVTLAETNRTQRVRPIRFATRVRKKSTKTPSSQLAYHYSKRSPTNFRLPSHFGSLSLSNYAMAIGGG